MTARTSTELFQHASGQIETNVAHWCPEPPADLSRARTDFNNQGTRSDPSDFDYRVRDIAQARPPLKEFGLIIEQLRTCINSIDARSSWVYLTVSEFHLAALALDRAIGWRGDAI